MVDLDYYKSDLSPLTSLLSEEELEQYTKDIKEEETPLWKYWKEFVIDYLRSGYSEVTLQGVRDTVKFVIRRLNILSIEQCNSPKILKEALHTAKSERSWSNNTFNDVKKRLITYFKWLEEMEYIEENKITKIRKCKPINKEQCALNEAQIKELMEHLHSRRQTRLERWRNTLFFGLSTITGARATELLAIQCQDIEKVHDTYKIIIRGTKTDGRPRPYRFPSWLRDTYEMYLHVRQSLGREEPNLFVSTSKRTGWTRRGLYGLTKRLSKELGFKVTPHPIRRYVATQLDEANLELKDIMRHLGHNRLKTTEKYIQRSHRLTDKGVDILSAVIR